MSKWDGWDKKRAQVRSFVTSHDVSNVVLATLILRDCGLDLGVKSEGRAKSIILAYYEFLKTIKAIDVKGR